MVARAPSDDDGSLKTTGRTEAGKLADRPLDHVLATLVAGKRTSIVIVRRVDALSSDKRGPTSYRDRVAEICIDHGRLLTDDAIDVAAARLGELLRWPRPITRVLASARRTGACAALPLDVVIERARQIASSRVALLTSLSDPTALCILREGATARVGDAHERALLESLRTGERSAFELLGVGRAPEVAVAALERLLARGAIAIAGSKARRGADAVETAPSAARAPRTSAARRSKR